jgi:hypothetical protein
MPGKFRAADGRLVAIVRYDRELIGEILFLDSRLNCAVRESIGLSGAPGFVKVEAGI